MASAIAPPAIRPSLATRPLNEEPYDGNKIALTKNAIPHNGARVVRNGDSRRPFPI
jgi:hypothetical protein